MKRLVLLSAVVLFTALTFTSCSSDDDPGEDLMELDANDILKTMAGTTWSVRWSIASTSSNEHESWKESWTFLDNNTLIVSGSEDGEKYTDEYTYAFRTTNGNLYFVLDHSSIYEVEVLKSKSFRFFANNRFETETISGSR